MIKKEWSAFRKNWWLKIVAVAIIAIPSIYAGVFLGSIWDPYGNTKEIPVAVVNEDKKVEYNDSTLNVGKELAKSLQNNDSMDFKLVDSKTADQGLKDGDYYIVTDRWQKYTRVTLNEDVLDMLASFCDEFLIHAVDVEGKVCGIEKELVALLGRWNRIPITYAGGIRSLEDIRSIKELGRNRIHITVGSALNLYGGKLDFDKVQAYAEEEL